MFTATGPARPMSTEFVRLFPRFVTDFRMEPTQKLYYSVYP
jgi:hypothetical protein